MNDITLDDVWNFCDRMQKEIDACCSPYKDMSEFEQGKIIAYRQIQFLIKGKCSNIPEEELSK